MLKVQEYLLTHSFTQLYGEHGVKSRPSANGHKWSLNYDQIAAKVNDPIANECRGLVLYTGPNVGTELPISQADVLARPMDRFLNLGDTHAAKIDWSRRVKAQEKVDGTMALLYWDPYISKWCVGTRSVSEADVSFDDQMVTPLPQNTFYELFRYCAMRTLVEVFDLEAEPDLFENWVAGLDKSLTYTYEICSPYNQVVCRYPNPRLILLCARKTQTGEYVELPDSHQSQCRFLELAAGLEGVPDNWDGEGASAPTRDAISGAEKLYTISRQLGLLATSIIADPHGGVNIHVKGSLAGAEGMILYMNDGSMSVAVIYPDESACARCFTEDTADETLEWLTGEIGVYIGPVLGRPLEWELKSGEETLRFVEMLDPAAYEGAVLVDADYNRVKVKSEAWKLASRAKDVVTMSKRGALEVIIQGQLEPVLPLLSGHTVKVLCKMQDNFKAYCLNTNLNYKDWFLAATDRKDFALRVQASDHWQSPYFARYSDSSVEGVQEWLLKLSRAGKLTHSILDSVLKEIGETV